MTKYYNRTNTCNRCKLDFHGKALREYNKEGNWTGKWICQTCYWIIYREKCDGLAYLRRQVTNRRSDNQNPNSTNIKGDEFQELTCRWRSTVSTIPVEDLNKKLDNYNSPIDHSRDSELGIIQTKGRLYDSYYQTWGFKCLERDWYKEFDNMICYCANKDGKDIERIYIFPKEEIERVKSISIYKNPSRIVQWYEEYRVIDEETIKKVNDIWRDIINGRY